MTYSGQQFASPSEALAHFGIKGMRWGVVNQDKPSGAAPTKQEKRAVKAEKFETKIASTNARVADIQKELNTLPTGYRTGYRRYTLMNNQMQLEKNIQSYEKDAQRVRDGKLTSTQKKVLIGAAVVGVIGGAVVLSQMSESGQLNSLKLRGEAALKGQQFDFLRNEKFANIKDPKGVLDDVVKGINPNYKKLGGQMNCRRCSFAYELRRRGYDVTATPTSIGMGQSESGLINALSPGMKKKIGGTSIQSMVQNAHGTGSSPGDALRGMLAGDQRTNPADIFSIGRFKNDWRTLSKDLVDPDQKILSDLTSAISKNPSGARGEALFHFGGFGHSMSWENFNGRAVIFDTQKGQMYDLSDGVSWGKLVEKWGKPQGVEGTRLDNMVLDKEFVSRWVTNTVKNKVKG